MNADVYLAAATHHFAVANKAGDSKSARVHRSIGDTYRDMSDLAHRYGGTVSEYLAEADRLLEDAVKLGVACPVETPITNPGPIEHAKDQVDLARTAGQIRKSGAA